MISGDPRRPCIDDTFADIVSKMPSDFRRHADGLPSRLGLTEPGGGWEDFIVTDLNRDLPRYAAEDPFRPGQPRITDQKLAAFRRAHHCAIIHGLIEDRVSDRQVASSRILDDLRSVFLDAWLEALSLATASPERARSLVEEALRHLSEGNRREQDALERARHDGPGALRIEEYVAFTPLKLRWFSTAARGVLLFLDEPERARRWQRGYDIFSIAFQCIDDALDEEADLSTRAMSFPRALGLPRGGLLAAAHGLMSRSSSLAERDRFHEQGEWLGRVGARIERLPVPGDPLQMGLAASMIHAAVDEAIHVS